MVGLLCGLKGGGQMPLISQQNVLCVNEPVEPTRDPTDNVFEQTAARAIQRLLSELEDYPPCRIVSISTISRGNFYTLTAVVETV